MCEQMKEWKCDENETNIDKSNGLAEERDEDNADDDEKSDQLEAEIEPRSGCEGGQLTARLCVQPRPHSLPEGGLLVQTPDHD